jgi:hypothetical protein
MKIHDRRSKDVLRNRHVSIIEVEDPYERGEMIVVSRQLRGDPLGRLHAHGQIDQAQYNAGRTYQRDWETAERGAKAIDPSKEAVDGGQIPEPLTDRQLKARKRLMKIHNELGRRLTVVIQAVLIEKQNIRTFSGSTSQSILKRSGNLFRVGLDEIAEIYGFANGEKAASVREAAE